MANLPLLRVYLSVEVNVEKITGCRWLCVEQNLLFAHLTHLHQDYLVRAPYEDFCTGGEIIFVLYTGTIDVQRVARLI